MHTQSHTCTQTQHAHKFIPAHILLYFAFLWTQWHNLLIKFYVSTDNPVLCSDVLYTASEVVRGLPPLSLANESQITALGVQSLQQVTRFLRQAALPTSGADSAGICI